MAARRNAAEEERRLRGTYISGNVVPKPVYEPERKPQQIPLRRPKQRSEEQPKPLFSFRRGIDFLAMATLLAALGITLLVVIQYLSVSAKIIELDKSITNLTAEYEALHDANQNRLADIASEVDLNEVYEIAVGKLGMVYPKDNQIITYDYEGEGYVRQYSAIPAASKETQTLLEQVLNQMFRK